MSTALRIFGIAFDGRDADKTTPEELASLKISYGVPVDMEAADFIDTIRKIDSESDYSPENALNGVNLAFKKMDILRATVEPEFIVTSTGELVVKPFSYEKGTAVLNGVRYALSEFAPNAPGFVGIGNEDDLVLSYHNPTDDTGPVHGHLFGTADPSILEHYGLETRYGRDVPVQSYYFMGKHLTRAAEASPS